MGAGRYIQCPGALRQAGKEMAAFGKKVFILYGGRHAKEAAAERLTSSLKKAGLKYEEMFFEGASTEKNMQAVADIVRQAKADIVAGVGGGRILDIAKAAGDATGRKIFTIPTSAATCAAFAVLYVVYGEDGHVDHSGFLQHEISGVIVDTDIVVRNCPKRYFVSGIVDAMAKKPEFQFTMEHLEESGMIATSVIATKIADFTYEKYLNDTDTALHEFEEKKNTALLDDMVNMNIMLTGMVSDLSTGGKQLAIAHNFYDAICFMHKEVRKKYLHGEIVAMALPLQLSVNGASREEIDRLKVFLKRVGIPTSIREAGVPEDALQTLIQYVYQVTMPDNPCLLEQIRTGFQEIW